MDASNGGNGLILASHIKQSVRGSIPRWSYQVRMCDRRVFPAIRGATGELMGIIYARGLIDGFETHSSDRLPALKTG